MRNPRFQLVYGFVLMPFAFPFAAQLGAHVSITELGELQDLDATLESGITAARIAWADVEITDAQFMKYLACKLCDQSDMQASLQAINWPELYLACGCSHGLANALAHFESQYLSTIPLSLAHTKLGNADIEEVAQGIREKLLVKDQAGAMRLDQYAGEGKLHGLIKVMAVRTAISIARKTTREHPDPDDHLLRLPSLSEDPELGAVKAELREYFKEAFTRASDELEPRERNLLRLHLLDGVTLEQLATNYSVHRATVTRWLAKARQSLLKNTQKYLQQKLPDSEQDISSFAGLVESRLDLSYSRLLKTNR